ncbi:MAG TPA: hypothetical protein VFJ57_13550 [Solirubrobacterales bacterium]|nr:hypothetical protein [Solirubrobacterales bacterium]
MNGAASLLFISTRCDRIPPRAAPAPGCSGDPVDLLREARLAVAAFVIEQLDREPVETRLVEIPDAGHDLHLERSSEWRRAVEEFLAGIR